MFLCARIGWATTFRPHTPDTQRYDAPLLPSSGALPLPELLPLSLLSPLPSSGDPPGVEASNFASLLLSDPSINMEGSFYSVSPMRYSAYMGTSRIDEGGRRGG